MSTNSCQVVFDSWDYYVSGSDEQPLFVSFDVEAARQDLTDTSNPRPPGETWVERHRRVWRCKRVLRE